MGSHTKFLTGSSRAERDISQDLHDALTPPGAPPLAVSARAWGILVLLGVGPMGLAFYLWDAAMKRGDPRVIGALAYLTPLLSTLLLVLGGGRRLTLGSGCAMGLILGGALLGSLDLLRPAARGRQIGRAGAAGRIESD